VRYDGEGSDFLALFFLLFINVIIILVINIKINFKFMKKIIVIFFITSFLFLPLYNVFVFADSNCPSGSVCKLTNPLGNISTPQVFIGTVIKGLLGVTGSIALLMFIYGGFTWMISRGEPAGTKKGLDAMLWATIGLIVIFSSYALVSFVFTNVLGVPAKK
jgi:hypothetical protein